MNEGDQDSSVTVVGSGRFSSGERWTVSLVKRKQFHAGICVSIETANGYGGACGIPIQRGAFDEDSVCVIDVDGAHFAVLGVSSHPSIVASVNGAAATVRTWTLPSSFAEHTLPAGHLFCHIIDGCVDDYAVRRIGATLSISRVSSAE